MADEFDDKKPMMEAPPATPGDTLTVPRDASFRPAAVPQLQRYRIAALVGSGGFGIVYKGYDEELKRFVAIKVPQRQRTTSPVDVNEYLAEAQALARLDHPGIVPVYDVGRTE